MATIIAVTLFHVMAVAALFTFSWTNLAVAVCFLVARQQRRCRHRLSPSFDASRI